MKNQRQARKVYKVSIGTDDDDDDDDDEGINSI
jgi:hypothetical protein